MAQIDGLAFYNSGPAAGASQQHKHLQLVPLPVAPSGPPIPMQPALHLDTLGDGVSTSPRLPFVHGFARLDPDLFFAPATAAAVMLGRYNDLLQATGLSICAGKPSSPYNLLITRHWMLLVPRTSGVFDSLPANGLGFAGSLLAKDDQSIKKIKEYGPMTLLKNVAVAS